MTHRERWLSTVCDLRTDGLPVRLGESIAGAPRQPGAFRTVMALLSMYADNDTGANARPSLRLLQSISHYKYATVHGALGIAQKAGYITATGTWTPPKGGDPITVWALGYPTPDGFVPWCMGQSVTPPDGTTDGDSTGRNHRPPVGESTERNHRPSGVGDSTGRNVGDSIGRNVGDSTGRSTTSSTSRPQGSEGEEVEALRAPTPDGSARTRLTSEQAAAVANVITAIIPAVAQTGIDCGNADLGQALADAREAGWDLQRMAAVLADMKTAKKSPTGQAITRIRELASKDPAAILIASEPTTASTTTTEKVAATDGKQAAPSKRPPADPLADFTARVITDTAKRLGWTVAEFREFAQRLVQREFVLTDKWGEHRAVDIDHDGYFAFWQSKLQLTPSEARFEVIIGDAEGDEFVEDGGYRLDTDTAHDICGQLTDYRTIARAGHVVVYSPNKPSPAAVEAMIGATLRVAFQYWSPSDETQKPRPTDPTTPPLPRHLEEWLDYLPTLGHDPEPARQALREAEYLGYLTTRRMLTAHAPIGYTTGYGPDGEVEVRWTAYKDGRTVLEIIGDDLLPLTVYAERGRPLEGFRLLRDDDPRQPDRLTSSGSPRPDMLPQALQLLAEVTEREASA